MVLQLLYIRLKLLMTGLDIYHDQAWLLLEF